MVISDDKLHDNNSGLFVALSFRRKEELLDHEKTFTNSSVYSQSNLHNCVKIRKQVFELCWVQPSTSLISIGYLVKHCNCGLRWSFACYNCHRRHHLKTWKMFLDGWVHAVKWKILTAHTAQVFLLINHRYNFVELLPLDSFSITASLSSILIKQVLSINYLKQNWSNPWSRANLFYNWTAVELNRSIRFSSLCHKSVRDKTYLTLYFWKKGNN